MAFRDGSFSYFNASDDVYSCAPRASTSLCVMCVLVTSLRASATVQNDLYSRRSTGSPFLFLRGFFFFSYFCSLSVFTFTYSKRFSHESYLFAVSSTACSARHVFDETAVNPEYFLCVTRVQKPGDAYG